MLDANALVKIRWRQKSVIVGWLVLCFCVAFNYLTIAPRIWSTQLILGKPNESEIAFLNDLSVFGGNKSANIAYNYT